MEGIQMKKAYSGTEKKKPYAGGAKPPEAAGEAQSTEFEKLYEAFRMLGLQGVAMPDDREPDGGNMPPLDDHRRLQANAVSKLETDILIAGQLVGIIEKAPYQVALAAIQSLGEGYGLPTAPFYLSLAHKLSVGYGVPFEDVRPLAMQLPFFNELFMKGENLKVNGKKTAPSGMQRTQEQRLIAGVIAYCAMLAYDSIRGSRGYASGGEKLKEGYAFGQIPKGMPPSYGRDKMQGA
ncbi:MAG: hypothetical protein V1659_03195 [Candidatus Woesearchaeota archaeon]